nr:uncharacterized protein I303_02023 [Kwoniella dejecticola CBS 10117]OBR87810.1 hypothetical protein I303_02023 [Kwoniella dejecticola CBS 10117]
MEDKDEDDWLEPPVQGGAADPLVNQEFERLSNKFSDAGYREGITDGKLSTLQQGFDEGFAASVPLSRRVGVLRGKAAALLAIAIATASAKSPTASPSRNTITSPTTEARSHSHLHSEIDIVDSIRELIRQLSQLRRDDILPEDEERIAHEKEEHGHPTEGEGKNGNDDENKFELDRNDKRDLENLERSLEMMGSTSSDANANGSARKSKRNGEEVVRDLEGRLGDLERAVLRG